METRFWKIWHVKRMNRVLMQFENCIYIYIYLIKYENDDEIGMIELRDKRGGIECAR